MTKTNIIQFKQWSYGIKKTNYATKGRIALQLYDLQDYQPIATATVNLPDESIEEGHVFIKNWSENEGIYQALLKAGVIEPLVRRVSTGYVEAYVCKLLI